MKSFMFFRHRKSGKKLPPEGMSAADIQKQSSICTGETVIGFYDPKTDRLLQAVVVRSAQDVADYYRMYGFEPPSKL